MPPAAGMLPRVGPRFAGQPPGPPPGEPPLTGWHAGYLAAGQSADFHPPRQRPSWTAAGQPPPALAQPGRAQPGRAQPGRAPAGRAPAGRAHAGWTPRAQPATGGQLPRRRRWLAMTATAAVAIACLVAAVAAVSAVHAELVRRPTAAELSRAGASATARRWQVIPAGKIFPARLPYTADLNVPEHATRVSIDPGTGCAGALDSAVASVLIRHGCRGVLRASYLDEREGVVFTVGVVALPNAAAALAARARIRPDPVSGLRAFATPHTASASFSDLARQAETVTSGGPYMVLTTAGYADGRRAAATGESRPAVFAPASQLARAILAPLAAPAFPRCGAPGWTC
jgi:hypothetical protein